MSIPTLTHDGLVHCPPEFFDHWIVDHTLSRGMDRFSDPSHTSMEWRLRVNGSALAADAAAAHFDWERLSCGLARTAQEQGVSDEVCSPILAHAWRWGRDHPTEWMTLPRTFIWDQVEDAMVNVATGASGLPEEFDRRFDDFSPLPGFSMSEFLISEDLIHRVEVITRDRTLAKQFYLCDELLTFNYA